MEKKVGKKMFERMISLVGEEVFEIIQEKKVLLIGLGGVGSYALEALVRNGFMKVTVVDYDKIELSNVNRQLMTDSTNIGHSKVIESLLRAKRINPTIEIDGIEKKITNENIEDILNMGFDYVIDACDDISVKFLLMEKTIHYSYTLISCMGTAKKMDPTKLEITTLEKTANDPLARILRKKVKSAALNKKIHVVSSRELPLKTESLGSNNLVPSVAGLLTVSFIIQDILKFH